MFFHVDLDAFFSSVEQHDNPALRGKPVVVGASPGKRGVVSTCSYEARRFGIHSAMPISEAVKRCPHAAFLPVRMERYLEVSAEVMRVFRNFTPDVLQVSVDEASLDMKGTERLWGAAEDAARLVKTAVLAETGLTISIGIAKNRYVAKIASGLEKPDGLTFVPEGNEAAFIQSLRLKDLWGAGERTQNRFSELGITSVRELTAYSIDLLQSLFGKAGGQYLYSVSRGEDPGIYNHDPKNKSLGTETTFAQDIDDRETLETVLLGMCQQLCQRLYQEQGGACGIQLKIRYHDFTTFTAQSKRCAVFSCLDEIYTAAMQLLDSKWNGQALRLIGISLFGFSGNGSQLDLFNSKAEKAGKLEQVVFEVNRKAGANLTRARLLSGSPERASKPDRPAAAKPDSTQKRP